METTGGDIRIDFTPKRAINCEEDFSKKCSRSKDKLTLTLSNWRTNFPYWQYYKKNEKGV